MDLYDSASAGFHQPGANLTIAIDHIGLRQSSSVEITGHALISTQSLYTGPHTVLSGSGRGHLPCQGQGNLASNEGVQQGLYGGSYGGIGHFEDVSEEISKSVTYGDIFRPRALGSGGCAADNLDHYRAGAGGSALDMTVNGTCEIHGTVDLSGADALPSSTIQRWVLYTYEMIHRVLHCVVNIFLIFAD